MGIGLVVAKVLRLDGHDCVHLTEQKLDRLPDREILEKAREETRIILTHDLDFGRLLALEEAASPSVITFRLSDMRPDSVLSHLRSILDNYASDLQKGAAFVVSDKNIRRRLLPITPPTQ